MILSETQERFVKAIAAQVPLEQIAEIHFFQPIRQGGAESGVAVIATRPDTSHPEPSASHPQRNEAPAVPAPAEEVRPSISPEESAELLAASIDASEDESVNADAETLIDDASPATSPEVVEIPEAELALPMNVESGELAPPSESPTVITASSSNERYVIYTARYRLTLKGPDRGKWETNVVAEADAPLLTVDAVVRGVQRRSGDVEDPIRLTGEELIALARRTQHPPA